MRLLRLLVRALLALSLVPAYARAQEPRAVVLGHAGLGNLGHADSEQGSGLLLGGGLGYRLTPRIVVEGDVHRAGVDNVFGRENHEFTETTATVTALFRAQAGGAHVVAGGGIGWQRARTRFDEPPFGRVDSVETIRLLHARGGVEWPLSPRLLLRTDAVLWMGGGLDWIAGGLAGVGFQF